MTQTQKNLTIPIVIITLMMAWALFPENPYGYYVLLRLVSCFLFIVLFFLIIATIKYKRPAEYPTDLIGWPGVMLFLAILYNPIIQVHLTREIWSVLNIITIIILVTFWYSNVRNFKGTLVFADRPPISTTSSPQPTDTEDARNLVNEGLKQEKLDKHGEAVRLFDSVIVKYGKREEVDLIRSVAYAFTFKASSVLYLKRKEEAIKIYLEFIEKYDKNKTEEIVKLVNSAKDCISKILPNN